MSERAYKRVKVEELPLNPDGSTKLDLYLFLPLSNQYIHYIAAGDEATPAYLERLGEMDSSLRDLFIEVSDNNSQNPVQSELLGENSREFLKGFLKELSNLPEADAPTIMAKVESMVDEILLAAAPEAKTVKEYLVKTKGHLLSTNDTLVLTSLAILLALANSFDSKKSHKDLAYATLLMDLSLMDYSKEVLDSFYANPTSLSADILRDLRFHPSKSHQLAHEKIKSASEVTLALILNHHELFNGKGYPRGIRTDSLFPLVRVLALAVDVFEILRGLKDSGKPVSLFEIVGNLLEENVESHLRRHSRKLILTTQEAFAPDLKEAL